MILVPVAAAHAQSANTDANGGTGPNPSAAGASASAASTEKPASQNVTGYGYSDHTPTHTPARPLAIRSGTATHRPTMPHASGPVATLPGFEMLGEGGSRVFVELTQSVQVEERHARGTVTYVLKGAHVTVHNNQNPLVTVHFNTPVTRARLVPTGNDLLFILDLRATVTPTWKLEAGKEGSAVLNIDFPKGSYVSADSSATQ